MSISSLKVVIVISFLSMYLVMLSPIASAGICDKIKGDVIFTPKEGDYDSDFNFNVTITSEFPIKMNVYLTIWSDYRDKSTKKVFFEEVYLYYGNKYRYSCNFTVNFLDSEFYKGKFKEWVENDSENLYWEYTRYELKVKFHKVCTLKSGKGPVLRNENITIKNVSIRYNSSSNFPNEHLFDYIAEVIQNVNRSSLVLKIRNTTSGDFESKGVRFCDGHTCTVKWTVRLDHDHFDENLVSEYIITRGDSEKVLKRGKLSIYENFSGNVTPSMGKPYQNYTYFLRFNSSIPEKITLLVYNYSSKTWDEFGSKIYNNPCHPESIIWENIMLTSHYMNRTHDAKYRFKTLIASSNEFNGPFYKFNYTYSNLTVSPKRGLYTDIFNFSIDVKSERELELRLETSTPSGDVKTLDSKRYTNINNWQTISWTTSFTKDEGYTTYTIKIFTKNTLIDRISGTGPYIGIAEFRNNTIKPKIGTRDTNFLFCIECRAAEGISDHVYLEVCDLKGNIDEQKNLSSVSPNWKKFCFNYTPKNVGLGATKYHFSVANTESEEYDGPIVVEEILSNFQVNPDNGTNQTEFTFKVYPSIKPIEIINETYNITLQLSVDKINWIDVMEKPYDKCVVFQNISIDSLNLADKSKIISEWIQKGTLYWRIRGYVTNSNIVETKWDIDLKFLNHSFSPKKAWWNDTLLFTTTLSAKANGFVGLQLKADNGSIFNLTIPREEYNNTPSNQTFNWTINLEKLGEKEYEGKVKYRFIFNWGNTRIESKWYDGPTLYKHLKVNVINVSVLPNIGYAGDLPKCFEPIIYKYCINLSANKNTSVTLTVSSPSGEKFKMKSKEYVKSKSKEMMWESKENQSLMYNELGSWTYIVSCSYFDPKQDRFIEKEYYCGNGPEVHALLSNFTIDPEYINDDGILMYGDKVNISFDVKSLDNISVALYLVTQGEKHRVGFKKVHPGTTRLYFSNIDPLEHLKNIKSTESFSFLLEVSR